jgi:hypothetical protein
MRDFKVGSGIVPNEVDSGGGEWYRRCSLTRVPIISTPIMNDQRNITTGFG